MSTRTMQSLDENAAPAGEGVAQAAADFAPALPSVGAQLRAAREARGLTVGDMAGMLKLSPRQIEALEADDWDYLPVTTIIRGFVRNYSRALKLDTAALMATLDATAMPARPELHMPAATNATVPVERSLARRDYLRVASGALVLILALAAYFVVPPDFFQTALSRLQLPAPLAALFGDKLEPADKAAEVPVAAPASSAPTSADVPPAQATPPSAPGAEATPAVAPPGLPAATAPAPAAAPNAPPPAASATALSLSFRQASWVEVRDRSGQIIFSQLSQPGTQREIDGKPPYTLVVGNAGHVSVTYKGKPVDLSKRSKDDVARVIVE